MHVPSPSDVAGGKKQGQVPGLQTDGDRTWKRSERDRFGGGKKGRSGAVM